MDGEKRYSLRGALWAVLAFVLVLLVVGLLVHGQLRWIAAMFIAFVAAAVVYRLAKQREHLVDDEQPTEQKPASPHQSPQDTLVSGDRSIVVKNSFVTRWSARRVLPKLKLDEDENVILWISHWSIGALLFRIPIVREASSEPDQKPDPSAQPKLEWQSTRGIFLPGLATVALWTIALMIGFSFNPLPRSIPGGKEFSSARTALARKVNEATGKPGVSKKHPPTPAIWSRHIPARYARVPLLLSLPLVLMILFRLARWSTWYIVLTGDFLDDDKIAPKRFHLIQRPFKVMIRSQGYHYPFMFSKVQSVSIVGTRLQHWLRLTLMNITTYMEHEDDWILEGLRGLPRPSRLFAIVNQLIKDQTQPTPFDDATTAALDRNTQAVEGLRGDVQGLTAALKQRGGDQPASSA